MIYHICSTSETDPTPSEATIANEDQLCFEVEVFDLGDRGKWLEVDVEATSMVEAILEAYAEFRVYLAQK